MACTAPYVPVILRVGRGEVVVPEERHLLLQRPPAVHHAEQLALARVVDDRVGRELAARGDRHVFGLADVRIDVVGLLLVIQQVVDDVAWRPAGKTREILGAGAERHAPQHMLERAVTPGHS